MTNAAVEHIEKLVVVGDYSDHDFYQRNRVLVDLFRERSIHTAFVGRRKQGASHTLSVWSSWTERLSSVFLGGLAILRNRKQISSADLVFVPYPAYFPLLWLRLLGCAGASMVVADAFLELQSTVVDDRKMVAKGSLSERLLLAFQKFTLACADRLLIDTEPQRECLEAALGSARPEIVAIPVGIDEEQWTPMPQAPIVERVTAIFWGTLIPLHGVEVIVDAAEILEKEGVPIDIVLVGDGQFADQLAERLRQKQLASLTWVRSLLETKELRLRVSSAHICLGIFGGSQKAASVVPYKVHQALAANRAVITRASPALADSFNEESGLIACAPEDPHALATSISQLAARLRQGWKPQTRSIYDARFSRRVLRDRLEQVLPS
ncbi:MAG: glycosyltransferase family 4 protein [Pseudomonadota bacterium]